MKMAFSGRCVRGGPGKVLAAVGCGRARSMPARGFSLVELVVCLGIVMILVGLALPSLAGAKDNAKAAALLSRLRQNTVLVGVYANDWKDAYPLYNDPSVATASMQWFSPLVASGVVNAPADIDREGIRARGIVTFAMSFAMVYDPAFMRPGRTIPLDAARPVAVRQAQVAFPANKGLLWQHQTTTGPYLGFWCCGAPWGRGPVTFADGSGVLATARDFATDGVIRMENSIGAPIASTWDGYLGRDR